MVREGKRDEQEREGGEIAKEILLESREGKGMYVQRGLRNVNKK